MENTSLVWCKIFLMLMQNGDNNWGGDVQDCGYAKLAIPLCNAGLKIFWMSGSTDGPKTFLCGNVLWAWKHLFVSSFFEVSLYLLWQAIWLVTRYSGCSTIFRPNIRGTWVRQIMLFVSCFNVVLCCQALLRLISGCYSTFWSSGWYAEYKTVPEIKYQIQNRICW